MNRRSRDVLSDGDRSTRRGRPERISVSTGHRNHFLLAMCITGAVGVAMAVVAILSLAGLIPKSVGVPASDAPRIKCGDLVEAYRVGNGDRYTGKVYTCDFGISAAGYEDRDGVPCLLYSSDRLTNRPTLVARLSNRVAWSKSQDLNRRIWVEGTVVGAVPWSGVMWAGEWATLKPGFGEVPGSVVVVENARIVRVE